MFGFPPIYLPDQALDERLLATDIRAGRISIIRHLIEGRGPRAEELRGDKTGVLGGVSERAVEG